MANCKNRSSETGVRNIDSAARDNSNSSPLTDQRKAAINPEYTHERAIFRNKAARGWDNADKQPVRPRNVSAGELQSWSPRSKKVWRERRESAVTESDTWCVTWYVTIVISIGRTYIQFRQTNQEQESQSEDTVKGITLMNSINEFSNNINETMANKNERKVERRNYIVVKARQCLQIACRDFMVTRN